MSQFKKAFKGIDSAIKQGTARALNRALSSTKTKVVRQLREDTGLKTEVIKTRTRARSANQKRLGVILGIAVKFGIALSKFSPIEKRVKVDTRTGVKRTYFGITAKIGRQGRQLVPGAFMLKGKATEAVIGRKKAFNTKGEYTSPTAPKYPTVNLKTNVFTESAERQEKPMKQFLLDTFNRIVSHEINFAIQKKFTSNK